MATPVVTPIILMATRAATPIIRAAMPVVRGRISDSEACSIRRALRFHTNTERRRESPTNMRHWGDLDTNIRHDLHTTLTRRRDRPQAYPAAITTPATSNKDNWSWVEVGDEHKRHTFAMCAALLGKNRSSTPRSIIKGACTARLS